jgi:TRAP-type uncharacterized transport system fused permease subunit
MISAGFVGYFTRPLDLIHRAIFIGAGILMMLPASAISNGIWTDLIGAAIAITLILKEVRATRGS